MVHFKLSRKDVLMTTQALPTELLASLGQAEYYFDAEKKIFGE